jgi:hypothetical protein
MKKTLLFALVLASAGLAQASDLTLKEDRSAVTTVLHERGTTRVTDYKQLTLRQQAQVDIALDLIAPETPVAELKCGVIWDDFVPGVYCAGNNQFCWAGPGAGNNGCVDPD